MGVFKKRGSKANAAEQQERQEIQGALNDSLQELMDGQLLGDKIIWRNLGIILFLTFLGIIYIYNRNLMEARRRARVDLIQEVEGLRYESLSVALELIKISSQAEVVRRVEREGVGLEISKDPPIIIER
ncbi:MAG: hypothetical protein LBP56_08790 [Odoribacteraceae bacterium]|jgi:hypothetical protein|nr:hypothetical protein [Odoribacteraceae bacterium]